MQAVPGQEREQRLRALVRVPFEIFGLLWSYYILGNWSPKSEDLTNLTIKWYNMIKNNMNLPHHCPRLHDGDCRWCGPGRLRCSLGCWRSRRYRVGRRWRIHCLGWCRSWTRSRAGSTRTCGKIRLGLMASTAVFQHIILIQYTQYGL